MRLLLDTHAPPWWLGDDPRLGATARECIRDSEAVFVSAATPWELAVTIGVGKLDADLAAIVDELAPNGFALLPILPRHALALAALPRHHRDPFDRMPIAQARCEALSVVTADNRFGGCGIDVVACGQAARASALEGRRVGRTKVGARAGAGPWRNLLRTPCRGRCPVVRLTCGGAQLIINARLMRCRMQPAVFARYDGGCLQEDQLNPVSGVDRLRVLALQDKKCNQEGAVCCTQKSQTCHTRNISLFYTGLIANPGCRCS